MKYDVSELKKRRNYDTSIEGVIDYSNKKSDEFLDISECLVKGNFEMINEDMFVFNLHISVDFIMPCAITLKETKVPIDFDTNLVYTFKVVDDDSYEIMGNKIDLDEAIWGNILTMIPMRVVSEGAEYFENDMEEIDENNPFKEALEKLKKGE